MASTDKKAPPITLYTHALSPFGMKVYWALIFKRLNFTVRYVHPRRHDEIAFTGEKIVPVLKIGRGWRQDSRDSCKWLDELFADPAFGGSTPAEARSIHETDQWVTETLIALRFRRHIDRETRREARRDGRKYAAILQHTTRGVPAYWLSRHFWPELLRTGKFIRNSAAMTDQTKSVAELESNLSDEFERKIATSGYLAGTGSASYADLAAYAQAVAQLQLGLSGGLAIESRPAIRQWFRRVSEEMPDEPRPALFPANEALIAEKPPLNSPC